MAHRAARFVAAVVFLTFLAGVASHEGGTGFPHEHRCAHTEFVQPMINKMMDDFESIPMETHRHANGYDEEVSLRRMLQFEEEEEDPQPLRIKVDYQLEGLDDDKVAVVKDKLLPAMIGVLRRALLIRRPVKGPLKLPRMCSMVYSSFPNYCLEVMEQCGPARHNPEFLGDATTCNNPFSGGCEVQPGGEGAKDADFILYVSANNEVACQYNAVAAGGFCSHDMDNWYGLPNRPLAGFANFCPQALSTDPNSFGPMLDTAVHEVFHALAMNRRLMEYFTKPDGSPHDQVLIEKNGHTMVATPAVKRELQRLLDCDDIEGARLENEGGSGTAGNHWERRMFVGEMMVGNSIASIRDALTPLTLALAEDSGWYIPQYKNAGIMTYSFKKGCGFAEASCAVKSPELEGSFCWDRNPQKGSCTPDHSSVGYCGSNSLLDGCNMVVPFTNGHCSNPDNSPQQSGMDMGLRNDVGARCFPVQSSVQRVVGFQGLTRPNPGAACFQTRCKNGKAYVVIPETGSYPEVEAECPEGEMVDLADYDIGYQEGLIGPCPAPSQVCEFWGCPNDCSRNGQCVEGECRCHVGYVGDDCSQLACPEFECSEGYKCKKDTGICQSLDAAEEGSEGDKGEVVEDEGDAFEEEGDEGDVDEGDDDEGNSPEITISLGDVLLPYVEHPTTGSGGESNAEGDDNVQDESKGEEIESKDETEDDSVLNEDEGDVDYTDSDSTKSEATAEINIDLGGEEDNGDDGKPEEGGADQEGYVTVEGSAFFTGRLVNCRVFADIDGDREWDEKNEPGTVTDDEGSWKFSAPPDATLVLDPLDTEDCQDALIGLVPPFALTAPAGSSSISPLTSLLSANRFMEAEATMLDTVDIVDAGILASGETVLSTASTSSVESQPPSPIEVEGTSKDTNESVVNEELLNGLEIKAADILDTDVVEEVTLKGDKVEDAQTAAVVAEVITNTVTQVAALLTGRAHDLEPVAQSVLAHLKSQLNSGVLVVSDLATPEGVRRFVKGMLSSSIVETERLEAFFYALAQLNEVAFGIGDKSTGAELLNELASLTLASLLDVAPLVVQLESSRIDVADFKRETDVATLEAAAQTTNASAENSTVSVEGSPASNGTSSDSSDDDESDFLPFDLPFSPIYLFVALGVLVLALVGCCIYCCRKQRSRNDVVVKNPIYSSNSTDRGSIQNPLYSSNSADQNSMYIGQSSIRGIQVPDVGVVPGRYQGIDV